MCLVLVRKLRWSLDVTSKEMLNSNQLREPSISLKSDVLSAGQVIALFSRNLVINYRVRKITPLALILSQMSVIPTPISYFVEAHFNIIFTPKPRCSSGSSVTPVLIQINPFIRNPENHLYKAGWIYLLPEQPLTSEDGVSFVDQDVRRQREEIREWLGWRRSSLPPLCLQLQSPPAPSSKCQPTQSACCLRMTAERTFASTEWLDDWKGTYATIYAWGDSVTAPWKLSRSIGLLSTASV
jgi:hypothetical protein